MTKSKGVGRGRKPGARAAALEAAKRALRYGGEEERVYLGAPCKRCGNTERYLSNGGCISCQNKRPPVTDKLGAMAARDSAALRGSITYTTPNPCSKCGGHTRYVSNAGCVTCAKSRMINTRAIRAAVFHSTTCPIMWINEPPSPETAPFYALCPTLAAYAGEWHVVYTDAHHLSGGLRLYPGCDVFRRPASLQAMLNDKTNPGHEIARHLIPGFYPAMRAFNLKVRGIT